MIGLWSVLASGSWVSAVQNQTMSFRGHFPKNKQKETYNIKRGTMGCDFFSLLTLILILPRIQSQIPTRKFQKNRLGLGRST